MLEQSCAMNELESSASVFGRKIDAITDRSLSPDNIDCYADNALDDLILVIDEMIVAYTSQPTFLYSSEKDAEAASFKYFGVDVDKINATLDHISSVAELIKKLDYTIEKISTRTDKIILPPDDTEMNLSSNGGSFKERGVIPRLKTIVLLLSSRYGINVEDPLQFRITSGEVDSRLMRKESYRLVEIPQLERSLLVCDEEGNATYVFDSSKLTDTGISSSDLVSFSKAEIIHLLNSEPRLGTRLIYSDNFVAKIASFLEEQSFQNEKSNEHSVSADKLLVPLEQAPEGYMTKTMLASLLFGKDLRVRINLAIEALGDDLGAALQAKGRTGKVAAYYSPPQQQKIREWIGLNGYMMPPDDFYPLVTIPEKIPLDKHTIAKIIEIIKDDLGEVFIGARGGRPTSYYSLDQINAIMHYAESHDYLAQAPEGYLSVGSIAVSLGIGRYAVNKIISDIEPDFIKKRGKITESYFSPSKQAEISSLLEQRGHLTEVPQGYTSKSDFAELIGVEVGTIDRLVKQLENELGDRLYGRTSGGILTEFLSPDQQTILDKWMREKNYFTQPPDDYLTVVDLAKKFSVRNPSTIQSAAKRVETQLGEILVARGRNGSPVQFYSPTQQVQIKNYLDSRTNEK